MCLSLILKTAFVISTIIWISSASFLQVIDNSSSNPKINIDANPCVGGGKLNNLASLIFNSKGSTKVALKFSKSSAFNGDPKYLNQR